MLELASYGLIGLVGTLLVAFCFACKDESASFNDKHPSRSVDGAELCDPKGVERCTCAADTDSGLRAQKHEGTLNG